MRQPPILWATATVCFRTLHVSCPDIAIVSVLAVHVQKLVASEYINDCGLSLMFC